MFPDLVVLGVNQLVADNFAGTSTNAIHSANPKHLMFRLESLGYVLRRCHLPDDGFLSLGRRRVNFADMLGQFTRSQ